MQRRLAPALAAAMLGLAIGSPWRVHAQTPGDDEPMSACVSALASLLRSRLKPTDYPAAARSANAQGTVWFLLTCDFQGTFEGSWVERSSGSELLDQAAVRTVERVFPLGAAAPAECRLGHGFSVTLPLEYRLVPAATKR
jgi:TonB family protein